MAFVIADRVKETSTSTGTGNFTLSGAASGFQAFSAVLSSNDTTYYVIVEQGGTNWEVGIGTFTSPSTLARTTVLSSSNSGSAVNFSAGTKDVFITLPANRTVQSVDGGTTGLTPSTASYGAITLAGTLVAANGGTGQSSYTIGDLLYASGSTALSKLAGVATGNALISGGVGTAPSYGKIGLTTHISGTLPVGNGGTGATTLTANNVILGNGTSAVQFVAPGTSGNVLTSNGTTWTSAAASGGTGNIQTFTSSGTWTKPSGLSATSRVLIQAWGAGGSGGRGAGDSAGGGGGGYAEKWVALSDMGATETITIGAGGAAVTTNSTSGSQGGNTTVGSIMTAYGGGGGQAQSGGRYYGGGGGSPYAAGSTGNNSPTFGGRLGGGAWVGEGLVNITYMARGTSLVSTVARNPGDATNIWGGGAGGGGFNDGCVSWSAGPGFAVYGGGGGGASDNDTTGGTSLRGGNGGGGKTGATATSGSAPAGGGGASRNGYNSGAGGRGEVIITVFPM